MESWTLTLKRYSVITAFVCWPLFMLGGRRSLAAAPPSKGERQALYEIGRAWKERGLPQAIEMCSAATKAFPRSLDIELAGCILLEIDGQTEKAIARYEKLAKTRGGAPLPLGIKITVKEWTLSARRRLNIQLGRYDEAHKQFKEFWSAVSARVTPKKKDATVWRAFLKVEEAALLADGLKDHAGAARLLKEAELALRTMHQQSEQDVKKGKPEFLFQVAYRYCVFELKRLARALATSETPIQLPDDLLKLPPLDVEAAGAPFGMVLLADFTAGPFAMPSHLDMYELAHHRWMAAIAERTRSRSIRATCSYLAGIFALQHDDVAGGIRYLTLCAETDSWMKPVAAAALARVAVEHADKCIRDASTSHPAEAPQLKNIRKRLAEEFQKEKVTPLRIR